MSRRLVFRPSARKDLHEIVAYIGRDRPETASRWLDEAQRALSRLKTFPDSGSLARDSSIAKQGYRMLVLGEYLAFYKAERDAVRVYRVVHGKRRFSFLL